MTKETPRAEANPVAPMFSLWRGALDEMDRHAEQLSQHGGSHMEEAVKVGRVLRGQMMNASRSVVDACERAAGEALTMANSWKATFGRGAA